MAGLSATTSSRSVSADTWCERPAGWREAERDLRHGVYLMPAREPETAVQRSATLHLRRTHARTR